MLLIHECLSAAALQYTFSPAPIELRSSLRHLDLVLALQDCLSRSSHD